MDLESLKKAVVDEVLRRLEELSGRDRRRALVVVTGALSDPAEVLSRIEAVGRAGFRVTVLLSKTAGRAFPTDELAKLGSILADDDEPAPALVNEADLVVVPWLSLNTASKVANLSCDTPATSVLVLALLLGKPVIACADEFDPQNESNAITRDLASRSPELHQAIVRLREKLRAYGVRIALGREFSTALPQGTHDGRGKRRVVTREDVIKAINRGEPLKLTPGTILTPLAKEVVESHGWPVLEEGLRCGRGW